MPTLRSVLLVVAIAAMGAGCSHTTVQAPGASGKAIKQKPPGSAAGSGHPQPSASPSVAPSAAPSATQMASATPSPAITPPKLSDKVPRLPPDALPKILAVAVSQTTVHPGDVVSGSVVTTSNVASVEARIGGYGVNLAKVGVGRFTLTYTVGPLPWFVRGNFTMRVIAHNTRGDSVERTVPLTVR